MTGSKMQKIVRAKHKNNVIKEQRDAEKKKVVDNAIAKLRVANRKKKLPKRIKSNPKL